jgi:hypothetical protein
VWLDFENACDADMSCFLLSCFALQTAGRQLQAATEATVTVRSTFAGTTAPAIKVVEAVEKAGCVGIPGLGAVFTGKCQEQRGFVSEAQIKQGGISLVQNPMPEGEPLQFVATYTEDGQPVSQALPIALTTQPAGVLDCSNTPQGGAQVFTCWPLQKQTPGVSIVVIATGPNPAKPSDRVTASITIAGNQGE